MKNPLPATALASLVTAIACATVPQPADAMTAQSIIDPYGFVLNLGNNDAFAWDTLELNFQDGYNTDMHVTPPGYIGETGQSGNTLYFSASPPVPNAGPLSNPSLSTIYEGPFASVDFTEHTADPDMFGTLEITAWDAGQGMFSQASVLYPIPDIALYEGVTAQEPCAGLPPGSCTTTSPGATTRRLSCRERPDCFYPIILSTWWCEDIIVIRYWPVRRTSVSSIAA